MRRTAKEIERTYYCPFEGCDKTFGSEGSQNLHIKIKHNGGNKTDREKLARQIIEAYSKAESEDPREIFSAELIDKIDLNLPPGILT